MSSNQLEQAVFTSAQTGRGSGYQLVARSPAVSHDDARELTARGPSHDSLLFPELDRPGFIFFELPSGAFALGRTTADGAEYSQRRGMRVYTHFVIASAETLARFSNNPLALLKAARADGVLEPRQEIDPRLPSVSITGGASIVDRTSICRVREEIGDLRLATALDAMLTEEHVAIAASQSPEALFAALLSCLPLSCRTAFSFTAGLKFSHRRTCRLTTVSDEPAEHRQINRLGTHRLIDLAVRTASDESLRHGWARFIHKAFATDRLELLAEEFRRPREALTVGLLDRLGHHLVNDRQLWSADRQPQPAAEATADLTSMGPASVRQGHRSLSSGVGSSSAGISATDLEKIGQLDDTVFEAIEGKSDSIDQLRSMWPTVIRELSPSAIAESREQYLRRTLAVWKEQAVDPATSTPDLAADLLDLLCLLLEE